MKDVEVAEKIFRKDISSIKGKTTRRTPKSVTDDVIQIPRQLLNNNQNVVLCMDIVYVQGLPFLATISLDFYFRIIQYLTDTKRIQFLQRLTVFSMFTTKVDLKLQKSELILSLLR